MKGDRTWLKIDWLVRPDIEFTGLKVHYCRIWKIYNYTNYDHIMNLIDFSGTKDVFSWNIENILQRSWGSAFTGRNYVDLTKGLALFRDFERFL